MSKDTIKKVKRQPTKNEKKRETYKGKIFAHPILDEVLQYSEDIQDSYNSTIKKNNPT